MQKEYGLQQEEGWAHCTSRTLDESCALMFISGDFTMIITCKKDTAAHEYLIIDMIRNMNLKLYGNIVLNQV